MLSPSERSLLDLIRGGRVDAEIAVRLGIENRQVKARIEMLMARAGVATRGELRDWVEPEDDEVIAIPAAPEAVLPPPRGHRRRIPLPALLSVVAAVGGAAIALGWLVSTNEQDPISSSTDAAVPSVAGASPAHPSPTPMVTLGGLTAREAQYAGVSTLPAGVELTIVRGTALDRGVTVERVTETSGAFTVETVYEAPAGTRIVDALAHAPSDTVAVSVCRGCSGRTAGRNGATIEFLVARGRGAEFTVEWEGSVAAGEAVPRLVAILPSALVLQTGLAEAPVFEPTSGTICQDAEALAIAPTAGAIPQFSLKSYVACGADVLFATNTVRGIDVTASRQLSTGTSISSWSENSFLGKAYFVGRLAGAGGADSEILRTPDIAYLVGVTNDGQAIGYMRTDQDTAVVTPVIFDLARGTYAFFAGPLYAVPPHSRLIEVSMIDRPPETIQVIAVRDSNP